MSDFTVDVVIDAQAPANTVCATVEGEKVTVKASPQVEDAALATLQESIAKVVREEVRRRKNGGSGLLMASGIV